MRKDKRLGGQLFERATASLVMMILFLVVVGLVKLWEVFQAWFSF